MKTLEKLLDERNANEYEREVALMLCRVNGIQAALAFVREISRTTEPPKQLALFAAADRRQQKETRWPQS